MDDLYREAGLKDSDEDDDHRAKLEAVLEEDDALSARKRRLLLELYDEFVAPSAPIQNARDSA